MTYRDRIIQGDCRNMADIPDGTVQTCVTSPPYWGLRDYGEGDQLGLEAAPEEYVANLVAVFREVRRVLRDDGTVWLNLGTSFFSKKIPSDTWVLRDDLTTEQRAYVFDQLKALPQVREGDAPAKPDLP